ncbi:MAG: ACT domain-containing protein [Ruminococcaceae bacterium]|nr:ACT domain-containing protein [Oscillospiraceae bacterium]
MKSVITVMGKDGVGIIARVSAFLAQNKINIIDIAQTTNDDQFLMVMVVDMETSLIPFNEVVSSLKKLGSEIGQRIQVRHKTVFDSMHRI